MRWLPLMLFTVGCSSAGTYYDLALAPNPDPFVAGEEISLDIEISSIATGEMVTGATVTAEPWMPDMGHGTSGAVTVTELGDGLYQGVWTFSMAGTWDVTLGIDGDEGFQETLVSFDVQ